MIELLTDFPDNIVAAAAHDGITREDYEKVLAPAIEEKLKKHKKIRLFYRLDGDFSQLTAGALWKDIKLSLRHLTAFEKIAIVTDVKWIVEAVKGYSFFVPCPVKTFASGAVDEARIWIGE